MRHQLQAALIVSVAVFVLIQVLPGVGRTNPGARAVSVPPPPEVQHVLRRACYDCHSNETRWPRVSRVAPIGWIVERQVYGARAKMNFSQWPDDPRKQAVARHKIGTMLQKGKMPLGAYWVAHREAQLSQSEINLLAAWAESPVDASPLADAAAR